MKAPNFSYVKPNDLAEALALLEQHGSSAMLLAGGQSLLAMLNLRLLAPEFLIDIGDLSELKNIAVERDTIRIGPLVRHVEILRSPLIKQHLPLLSEAITHVGHVAIRNRGTIGGSLANADPAAELPACMVALGGMLVLESRSGRREVSASQFFKGLMETDLKPGELIVEVRLPKQSTTKRWGFSELSRRQGDFAVVGLTALADIVEGQVSNADLVYFGCADRPKRAMGVAAGLQGRRLPLSKIEWLTDAIQQDLAILDSPGWKAKTKLHIAAVLTKRLLQTMNA
jgi:aerobic carbon-monoxide dehydrogenase medium subunit